MFNLAEWACCWHDLHAEPVTSLGKHINTAAPQNCVGCTWDTRPVDEQWPCKKMPDSGNQEYFGEGTDKCFRDTSLQYCIVCGLLLPLSSTRLLRYLRHEERSIVARWCIGTAESDEERLSENAKTSLPSDLHSLDRASYCLLLFNPANLTFGSILHVQANRQFVAELAYTDYTSRIQQAPRDPVRVMRLWSGLSSSVALGATPTRSELAA